MTDRRSGTDRRSQARGGRRLTDLDEATGWVTVPELCRYFGVSRRTLVKLFDHFDVPIARLSPTNARCWRVHVEDAVRVERALRGHEGP